MIFELEQHGKKAILPCLVEKQLSFSISSQTQGCIGNQES